MLIKRFRRSYNLPDCVEERADRQIERSIDQSIDSNDEYLIDMNRQFKRE